MISGWIQVLHPCAIDFIKNMAESVAYCDQFWQYCDDKVAQLNESKSRHRKNRTLRINEQGTAPHVYGVLINHIVVEGDVQNVWKLVKVGQTAVDTSPGNNRMETVKGKVEHWCAERGFQKPEILFVLRISGDDDEEKVRMAFGLQVSRALGKQLNLPIHTEWVLTSQMYIASIRKSINDTSTAKRECTSKLITQKPFSYCWMQKKPNAVTVGSLNLLGTQIPVCVSKTDSSITYLAKYTVLIYELSLPTPTEDEEPPPEEDTAVSSPASRTGNRDDKKPDSTTGDEGSATQGRKKTSSKTKT